ncbi:hypothetical protein ACQIBV_004223 [Yersinia enterocolitica]|uniref:hypothetical protein n=1 Tax=Yersinia TaxID=629 RepID=UPI0005E0D442|nr:MULTISPECIES: hypothetical protein [Yersinia]EKN3395615.1 hypothetical protein [Yersinia enterocolitica]EKN3501177.1 hypothetical protein [Yersinia enterocolitica]EKN3636629.1 hypothetical protein [Yersinia enterocolitica]EKN3687191.1 hypothetical protein [Yersinia enterocolitica]EKN3832526.1 hypothetical protein [Yersinia enterocolitica]
MYLGKHFPDGIQIKLNFFGHTADPERRTFDCPHMAWVLVDNPYFIQHNLGQALIRINRYVIEDDKQPVCIGKIVGARTLSSAVVYEDLNPVLLGMKLKSFADSVPAILRVALYAHYSAELTIVGLVKAHDFDYNQIMLFEYLNRYSYLV